ncbi:MAG: exonuclease domain-containing protein [Lachnospiraceae bacterium]|nr:exonuclease domain-containing protein [Lachnospiraceae bacterium]
MDYIVFDLEWNQSNTGKEPEVKELPFEIIDIGAIRMSTDRRMIGEYNQLVKPTVYQHMHHITSKIIHLHMQDLQRGIPFKEAVSDFLQFCGDDYVFCTWGTTDVYELRRNMRFYGIEPLSNGPLKFLDVQKLYSLSFEDGKSRRNLEYAIDALKIDKDIPFHRAFSDAYYTAKVLSLIPEEMLDYCSFDTFLVPESKEDEVHIRFKDYSKYISREFDDKHEAMIDKEVASTKCFVCNKNIRKKVRWFSPNGGKHFYSVAECPVHGFVKYKNRMRKTESDGIYVVKTTKLIDEETYLLLAEKRRQIQESKKNKEKEKN